nr:DegV family protein [Levilactobacillus brevis]
MYKIMTDSECGLPAAFLNQHEVGVVRSFVQLEDHQFGDYFYDQQNTAAFYDTLKHGGIQRPHKSASASTSRLLKGLLHSTYRLFLSACQKG